MDRARDHLLAGTGLAAEQHGRVARADAIDEIDDALRRLRAADELAGGAGRARELFLERVRAPRDRIARIGADPRGTREVRDAVRRERIDLIPGVAFAVDPQDPEHLVIAAVDRRRDQRAVAGL